MKIADRLFHKHRTYLFLFINILICNGCEDVNRVTIIPVSAQTERTVEFVLETKPCPARILILRDGIEQEVGTTPYTFSVKCAAEMRRKDILLYTAEKGFEEAYMTSVNRWFITTQDAALVKHTVHPQGRNDLRLQCKLIAEGYQPQIIDRYILELGSPEKLPEKKNINIWMETPSHPQISMFVNIDSIPQGATVYSLAKDGTLGEKIGITPTKVKVGLAECRDSYSGSVISYIWWKCDVTEPDFITCSGEGRDEELQLNFSLVKDGFAIERVTRKNFCSLNPDVGLSDNRTITIPLKTPDEARQERLERFEQARLELAAALKKIELDMKQTEISNQQELIRQQVMVQQYLQRLETASERLKSQPDGTIIVKHDPYYDQEWQVGMRALGDIVRPHSKLSPVETEEGIRALEGFGTLLDLLDR